MQHVSTGSHTGTANVLFLPIIDLKSSDESCIYSTLKFIQSQAGRLNIETPVITFDQPLWIKAVEIIRAKSSNIFCTLGGFHMMMSFSGSIGFVMNGSGLSDVLETAYDPKAISHMMSGKTVSRAIRGHFLVDSSLMIKLWEKSHQAP